MSDSGPIGRILVVDDKPLILHVFKVALAGYAKVKAVATAEEALEEVSSHFYDLCFLDFILPGLNGLQAMKKISEISPETKVVIMTANYLDEQIKQVIEECAYHFIEKPFDLEQIREVSRQALQNV